MKKLGVKINFQFELNTNMAIGAGHGKHNLIDNAVKTKMSKQQTEIYYIPGTSVKGRIRYYFSKIARQFESENDVEALMCEVFGGPGEPGWAKFTDLTVEQGNINTNIQANTAIDRARRGAKYQSLRIKENISPNRDTRSYFDGEVFGYIDSVDPYIPKSLAYLLLAIKNTTEFGSNKSSGYGRGNITFQNLKLHNQTYNTEQIDELIEKTVMKGE